jgi:diguanylate cyclase (GGDEF)-like protein
MSGERLVADPDVESFSAHAPVAGPAADADPWDPPNDHDMLVALCSATASSVGVDGVGVMLAEGQGLRFVHGQPEWVVDVERLQEVHGRGPCWDSLREHRAVLVQDVRTAEEWPELAHRARQVTDRSVRFRGVASLPLLVRGRSVGVLDLYRAGVRPWSEVDLAAAQGFARIAGSYLEAATDRDAWQGAWARAQHAATHDDLTGLPGRGLLLDHLDHAIASGTRGHEAVAVLLIDLDDLRTVDDALGHAAGDATLVEVTHRLASTLRADDTLARLSGDEFVIVCGDLTTGTGHIENRLHRFGERILLELRRPARRGETTIDVSVSIGAAVTTREISAHALTTQADQALHAAKTSGGGRLVINRIHRR